MTQHHRRPRGTATQRTLSIFTGQTDLDAPNARDGSAPDRDRATLRARPKHVWKVLGNLRDYFSETANATITITNERPRARDGRWLYLVTRRGVEVGTCLDMLAAAELAEASE